MIFELAIILISVVLLLVLSSKNKNSWKVYLITAIGVLLFEYYTQALWFNQHLEKWAYLYLDVSWIMTLMWTNVILFSIFVVETWKPKYSEIKKFFMSIGIITIFVLCIEWILIRVDIRGYPPVINQLYESLPRLFGIVPLKELIYVFAFMSLVVAFTRYWQSNYNLKFDKFNGGRK
jgi:FlaA1/EpsC-like NDP-sugar epimerase